MLLVLASMCRVSCSGLETVIDWVGTLLWSRLAWMWKLEDANGTRLSRVTYDPDETKHTMMHMFWQLNLDHACTYTLFGGQLGLCSLFLCCGAAK